MSRAGLTLDRIDCFEVNEAFASVVLAWMRETGADPERVNRFGGAIALGHPVGASGGRLLANLIAALEETGGRYGAADDVRVRRHGQRDADREALKRRSTVQALRFAPPLTKMTCP